MTLEFHGIQSETSEKRLENRKFRVDKCIRVICLGHNNRLIDYCINCRTLSQEYRSEIG